MCRYNFLLKRLKTVRFYVSDYRVPYHQKPDKDAWLAGLISTELEYTQKARYVW